MSTETLIKTDISVITKYKEMINKKDDIGLLIILNDDFNTFEHVIKTLKDVCLLDEETSIMHTVLIHTTGQSVIFEDKFGILEPICDTLCEKGLSAILEDK